MHIQMGAIQRARGKDAKLALLCNVFMSLEIPQTALFRMYYRGFIA